MLLGGTLAAGWWYSKETAPTPDGPKVYVRLERSSGIETTMTLLKSKGIIRNVAAMRAFAFVNRKDRLFQKGTYQLNPGMTPDDVFKALKSPIRQMVRLPETNWARRSANLLEEAGVAKAADYMAEFERPADYARHVSFPLPESGTLEGYLYPDTYELPPELGAKGVVERQLRAFEQKVMPHVKDPLKLRRALIIASLIELEVAKDDERPVVAGVIENRLRLKMPLQIDACVNYALQEWRPLTFKDLEFDSPYNTYRNKGLPPSPICSPSAKSVKAALNPAKHKFLYYVAMPEKYHLFATTFEEHRRNIAKRKAALADQRQ